MPPDTTSADPEISVVIPTYNRLDVLPEVLAALAAQENAPSYEVLVIDDGSNDGTAEWLARDHAVSPPLTPPEETESPPLTPPEGTESVRVFRQANQGPAAARNYGVREARGDRIAFLGDDTVPEPGWLAAHRRAVAARPEAEHLAVIGYTAWHSRMRLNPFLRYINEYGLQFGYALIEDPEDVPFNFLYTSNLSLPRRLLVDEPFDLRFPYPAWEDIELSYRMKKRGLRLVYEPAARVAHDHPTTIGRFKERQEKAGYSAVVFYLLHEELGPFLGLGPEGPPPLPRRREQLWRELKAGFLQWFPVEMPETWQELLRYHYIRGLERGWRDRDKMM